MTTVLGLNEMFAIYPSDNRIEVYRGKFKIFAYYEKKKKKLFMVLTGSKPFPPVINCYVEKLKLNQVAYHKKGVSIRQKPIFKRKNPVCFHCSYFNFEGKKLIVKTLFIKPLLV